MCSEKYAWIIICICYLLSSALINKNGDYTDCHSLIFKPGSKSSHLRNVSILILFCDMQLKAWWPLSNIQMVLTCNNIISRRPLVIVSHYRGKSRLCENHGTRFVCRYFSANWWNTPPEMTNFQLRFRFLPIINMADELYKITWYGQSRRKIHWRGKTGIGSIIVEVDSRALKRNTK